MKKKLKILSIVLISSLIIFFTIAIIVGTFIVKFIIGFFVPDEDYVYPEKAAKQQGDKIIESIINKDANSFKEVLCEKIKNKSNVESEISQILNFIDGNIISYDEPGITNSSGSSTPDEGAVRKEFGMKICNIKTDTGKTYRISYHYNHIYKENKELEGVSSVFICDEEKYNSENGYPSAGSVSISSPDDSN